LRISSECASLAYSVRLRIENHYVQSCHQAAAGIPLSATAVRPPGTWPYNAEELHPTCGATSAAVMVPDANIAFAALTWMAFNAGGRPPIDNGRGCPPVRLGCARAEAHLELTKGGEDVEDQPPNRARVSMFLCSDPIPMPGAFKASMVVKSWRRDRARPSSRATTST
jgi:hypothetical protein